LWYSTQKPYQKRDAIERSGITGGITQERGGLERRGSQGATSRTHPVKKTRLAIRPKVPVLTQNPGKELSML